MRLEALGAVSGGRTVDGGWERIRCEEGWVSQGSKEADIGALTLELDGNSGRRNGEEGKGKEELLELHDDLEGGFEKCSG